MSRETKDKKRVARPSSGAGVKSRRNLGVTDMTREVTGLDVNDNNFEANKKDISRRINEMKKISDIPIDFKLKENNFIEVTKFMKQMLTDNELRDANSRITNPKKSALLEDYDKMINSMHSIINQRPDDDYEKKVLNKILNNELNDSEELKMVEEIKLEITNLYDGMYKISKTMIKENRIKYFKEIKDKIHDFNTDIKVRIDIHTELQERTNLLSEKYPHIKEMDRIDLNDIETLGVDFLGELLGLPTLEDMKKIIEEINTGEI